MDFFMKEKNSFYISLKFSVCEHIIGVYGQHFITIDHFSKKQTRQIACRHTTNWKPHFATCNQNNQHTFNESLNKNLEVLKDLTVPIQF